MSRQLMTIFALFLLLSQTWPGVVRGREFCVDMGACEKHVELASDGCCVESDQHEHGVVDLAQDICAGMDHAHPDCGCHLHLTAPDHVTLAGRVLSGASLDHVSFLAPIALIWERVLVAPAQIVCRVSTPPPLDESDCRLALRATVLLI